MKNLALFCLLLAIGAAAFLWLGEGPGALKGSERPGPEIESSAPRERAHATSGAPLKTAPAEAPSSERAAVDTQPVVAVAGPNAERAVSTLAGPGRELRVIDGVTREPVADAAVWQCTPEDLGVLQIGQRLPRLVMDGPAHLDELLDDADFFRTGASGAVQVADTPGETLILVLGEGWRGYGIVGGAGDTGDVVELFAPRGLTVRTVDATGAPVGHVRLAVSGVHRGVRLGKEETDPLGVWEVSEVSTLLAPFNRVYAALDAPEDTAAVEAAAWLRIGVAGLAPEEWQTVDLREGGELTFVVGAGSVWVEVVDDTGAPVEETWINVVLTGDGEPREQRLGWDWTTTFLGLELGSAVTASVPDSSFRRVPLPEPVTGVVTAEGLRLTLVMESRPKGLRLRVVDADGPVAGLAVVLHQKLLMQGGASTAHQVALETDAEGVVACDPTLLRGPLEAGQLYEVFVEDADRSSSLRSEWIALPGPRELPIDLGDVKLRHELPFVAGRVVDATGAPVERARVRINHFTDNRFQHGGGVAWSVRPDEAGRFVVFGSSAQTDWFARATGSEAGTSRAVPFTPGTTDLVLELVPSGSIEMSLAAQERTNAGLYQVWLQPVENAMRMGFAPSAPEVLSGYARGASARFEASGRLTWSGLHPGMYTVTVELGGEPALVVEDVRVTAGQPTRDPRLTDMLPGAALVSVELDVVDEAGVAIPDPVVEFPPETELHPIRGGRITVPELGRQVFVGAPGYTTAVVPLNATHQVVTLSARPLVTLVFPLSIPNSDAARHELALGASVLGDDGFRDALQWNALAGDSITLPVEALGEQQLFMATTEQTAMGFSTTSWWTLHFTVDLAADCDGQVIAVELSEKERARLE